MKLVERHIETRADLTDRRPPRHAAGGHAVRRDGGRRRATAWSGFEEKPARPKSIPDDPEHALSSMGIYVFNARFLFEQLCLDATRPNSKHDFGRDIIPAVIRTHKVFAYPFLDENRKKDAYWRNVGTLEAYYEANMDLISVDPLLNLYDRHWPIRTYQPNLPPPKFVFAEHGDAARRGEALDSIVCQGTIISGGQVERSVLGPNVRINSYSHVEDSVLFDGVNVGRHAKIRRAIIDKDVDIPPGIEIGFDHELDRVAGLHRQRERSDGDRQDARRGAFCGERIIVGWDKRTRRVGQTSLGDTHPPHRPARERPHARGHGIGVAEPQLDVVGVDAKRSATICANVVSCPWPCGEDPLRAITRPLARNGYLRALPVAARTFDVHRHARCRPSAVRRSALGRDQLERAIEAPLVVARVVRPAQRAPVREGADQVAPAKLGGLEPQLARGAVDGQLEQVRALGPAGAAVGTGRHLVGARAASRRPRRRGCRSAGHQHRGGVRRDRGGRQQVRAQVGQDRGAHGQDPAAARLARARRRLDSPPLVGAQEVLHPVLDPLERPAQLHRGEPRPSPLRRRSRPCCRTRRRRREPPRGFAPAGGSARGRAGPAAGGGPGARPRP